MAVRINPSPTHDAKTSTESPPGSASEPGNNNSKVVHKANDQSGCAQDADHVIHVTPNDGTRGSWSSSDFTDLKTVPPSDNRGSVAGKLSIQRSNSSDGSILSSEDSEAAAHSKAFCWGLCCVQGCIWGVIAMVYFFLLLPTGFLLIMFGTTKGLAWAVATGSVVLVFATFGLPVSCLGVRYYRRRRRDRRAEYRSQRKKAAAAQTYDNQATEVHVQDDNSAGVVEVIT